MKLLTEAAAAKYLGIGVDKLRKLGIPRRRVYAGRKGLKYYVADLDKWLDSLPKDGEDASAPTNWIAKFDAENKRRKGLPQQREDVCLSPFHGDPSPF